MQFLLGVLIGAVVWQLITFLVAVFSNENEGAVMFTGCGIWILLGNAFIAITRPVYDAWKYRGLRTIVQHPELHGWHHVSVRDGKKFLQAGNHYIPSWTDELREKYPSTLWEKKYRNYLIGQRIEVGNLRFAPKAVWQDFPSYSL